MCHFTSFFNCHYTSSSFLVLCFLSQLSYTSYLSSNFFLSWHYTSFLIICPISHFLFILYFLSQCYPLHPFLVLIYVCNHVIVNTMFYLSFILLFSCFYLSPGYHFQYQFVNQVMYSYIIFQGNLTQEMIKVGKLFLRQVYTYYWID